MLDRVWNEHIGMLQGLGLETCIGAIRAEKDGFATFRHFYPGRGDYTIVDTLANIRRRVENLWRPVAAVYCADKGILFTSDADLVEHFQEIEWRKRVNVVKTADKTELISKVIAILCRLENPSFPERLASWVI